MTQQQRTALVTGGMGGLGEAIARSLHDAGHRVLLTHTRPTPPYGVKLSSPFEMDRSTPFVSKSSCSTPDSRV